MNNKELRDIIESIKGKDHVDIKDIAEKSGVNRSYLSTFINLQEQKSISKGLYKKLAQAYPEYFQKNEHKSESKQTHSSTNQDGNSKFADLLLAEKEARRLDAERHINLIREEKDKLYAIIDKLQSSLETQLTNLNLVTQSILLSQRAEHNVMLEAFDRLEKSKPGTLSRQADKKELELRETILKADMKVKAGT